MSEELVEPAGAEEPATDTPGAKIYICPACGLRYDDPTVCSNGHEPTSTVEYDRATVEAADAGDADAAASIAETATEAAGTTAGVPTASAEATPAPVGPVTPTPAAPAAAAAPAAPTPAAPATAAGATVDAGSIFAELESNVAQAIANAKTALGI